MDSWKDGSMEGWIDGNTEGEMDGKIIRGSMKG